MIPSCQNSRICILIKMIFILVLMMCVSFSAGLVDSDLLNVKDSQMSTRNNLESSKISRSFTHLWKDSLSDHRNSLPFSDNSCLCSNYTCGCCYHLDVQKIFLNNTGCLNITYLPDEYGLEVDVTLDDRIVFKRKISAKNPPSICGGIPYVHKLASICLRLYNLNVQQKQFSGCAALEVDFEGVILKEFVLGCFHIPPEGEHIIGKSKQNFNNGSFI